MPRLFITGGSGFIGGHLARLAKEEHQVTATYHMRRPDLEGINWVQLDITDEDAVKRTVAKARPDVTYHLAAVSSIDACEQEKELAHAVNVQGTANVAAACCDVDTKLIAISSDNVFDGKRGGYAEDDPVSPINYYGTSKAMAEEIVRECSTLSLVVRIPLTLGFPLPGARSHMSGIVNAIRQGGSLWFVSEEWRSPIDVMTLCEALLELSERIIDGVIHVAGTDRVSRAEMGEDWLTRLGIPLERASWLTVSGDRVPRPADISLDVTRASFMIRTPLPDYKTCADRIWANASEGDLAV